MNILEKNLAKRIPGEGRSGGLWDVFEKNGAMLGIAVKPASCRKLFHPKDCRFYGIAIKSWSKGWQVLSKYAKSVSKLARLVKAETGQYSYLYNQRVNRTARGGFVLRAAIVLKGYASIKLFGNPCCPLPLTLALKAILDPNLVICYILNHGDIMEIKPIKTEKD